MLKPYSELVKIDISKHVEKRDGVDYLNWAKCIDLLHEHGAEKVYFTPLTNSNGSSLFCSDNVFTDNKGNTNRCYETRIKVVIDDLEFEFQSPVMNGSNPVKDNSMTQQRLWNAQTRAFVKAVAIHTGLGFNLWSQNEYNDEKNAEEDLSKHNVLKIRQRIFELVTSLLTRGFSKEELAEKCGLSLEEWEAILKSYPIALNNIEAKMRQI